MLRFYRLSPLSFIIALVVIAGLLTLSLPLILLLVATSVVLRLGSGRRRRRKAPLAPPAGVSELIRNSQIGAYRIKQDEGDPTIIEVISSPPVK